MLYGLVWEPQNQEKSQCLIVTQKGALSKFNVEFLLLNLYPHHLFYMNKVLILVIAKYQDIVKIYKNKKSPITNSNLMIKTP